MTDRVDSAVFPWMRHKRVPIPKLSNHKKDTKAAPYHNVLTSSWNMSSPVAAEQPEVGRSATCSAMRISATCATRKFAADVRFNPQAADCGIAPAH